MKKAGEAEAGAGQAGVTAEAAPPKPYGAYAALWIGGGMMIFGAGLGIAHAYEWLRYGASGSYHVSALFADIPLGYPRVSWVGVQSVIDWIMASPAGWVLFISGGLLCWIGGAYSDDYDKQARDSNTASG